MVYCHLQYQRSYVSVGNLDTLDLKPFVHTIVLVEIGVEFWRVLHRKNPKPSKIMLRCT